MIATRFQEICNQIDLIDPVHYGASRNFITGGVTRLSPYISRGVVSTARIFHTILDRGIQPQEAGRLIQELAWRDYWQQLWIARPDAIDSDFRSEQTPVRNHAIPSALVNATTGIHAIDDAIRDFYVQGYLHNHHRMYLASLACNVAQSHWLAPAKWMYYHLLDADWASNAWSWQWVAGTNSEKKYYFNQENVNKYCGTAQHGTFLDVGYSAFPLTAVPDVLFDTLDLSLQTVLPAAAPVTLVPGLPTMIYNLYNLDPLWRADIPANRILLLEPSHFAKYPVSRKTIDFVLALGENIPGLQTACVAFDELLPAGHSGAVYFKEHPLNAHYRGAADSRDWMFRAEGYFPSFFSFWKQCKKEIRAMGYPNFK